jgi:hypothetical protein
MLKPLLFLVLCFLATACSVVAVRPYDPFYKNTSELALVKGSFKGVQVRGATAGVDALLKQSSMTCRLTTFNMPANKNVETYVQDALTVELDAAKKLSPNGPTITVTINRLESDTAGFNKGHWDVDFTYSTGKSMTNIKTSTEFESAFAAGTACRNTAQGLETALRENFNKFFSSLAAH